MPMSYPAIYTLFLPVQGDFSDTQIKTHERCPACQTQPDDTYYDWRITFDEWGGEDLITVARHVFVSERLKNKFASAGVEGVTYTPVAILPGNNFVLTDWAYQDELPTFYLLNIDHQIPLVTWPGWTYVGVCAQCHQSRWALDDITAWMTYSSRLGAEAPQTRVVQAAHWHGQDIFRLEHHGEIFVTEKVKDIVERLNQRDTLFFDAQWHQENNPI